MPFTSSVFARLSHSVIALCSLLLLSPSVTALEEWSISYWTLDEFYRLNPQQLLLAENMRQRISEPGQPLTPAPTTPLRITLVQPGNQFSSYWTSNIKAMQERLAELGIPYQLEVVNLRPDDEARVQELHIAKVLAQQPDYLITTLDTLPHKKVLERVLTHGRTKLILQNITTPLKEWQSTPPLLYVGFDHIQGSRMLADYLKRTLPANSSYGVLYWQPGYVSQARGDSLIQELQQHSQLQLHSAFYTEASRDSAKARTLEMLRQHPQPTFIYACATDLALGAADALAELGLSQQVALNGWGGTELELEQLQAGRLQVTVMRMNDDSGIAIAEAIRSDLLGEAVPQVFAGSMVLVTTKTPDTELQRLRHQAYRYSRKQP